MNKLILSSILFTFLLSSSPIPSTPSTEVVVHAVLFYSPGCGHCYQVITESLPPLFEKYGDRLYIVGVDVTQPDGQALFLTVLQYFNQESGPVPFLVVGDTYLIGSLDIPEKLPGMIENYLGEGGVDWPAIPGLAEAIVPSQPTESISQVEATSTNVTASITPSPTTVAPSPTPTPSLLIAGDLTGGIRVRFHRDLRGNTLAVIVLAFMILSVGGAFFFFRHLSRTQTNGAAISRWLSWLIPVLCLIGLGVAGYLAYVETAHIEAVCGPVGDCNTVQQSEYARLFGVLPVAFMGIAGYVMILIAWTFVNFARGRMTAYASLSLLGATTLGLLFSIYLTFLEPFVIGATCAWCLTSALIMTALFWLSFAPARLALSYLFSTEKFALKRSKPQSKL